MADERESRSAGVIIIGAGVAGLSAARALSNSGFIVISVPSVGRRDFEKFAHSGGKKSSQSFWKRMTALPINFTSV